MSFRRLTLSFSVLFLICLTLPAYGQQNSSINLTPFTSYPLAIGKPITVGTGVQGVFPINSQYSLITELMGGAPASAMTPSFFLMGGVGRKMTDRFSLALNGMYRFTPDYEDKGFGHAFGGTVAPSWKITDGIRIAMPVGVIVPLRGGQVGGSMAVKLVLKVF